MKSLFIAYDQAHADQLMVLLDRLNVRGFSRWEEVQGRGTVQGEPHYGSHAWPALCSAMLCIVRDEQVEPVLAALHALDQETPKLGLRAFVWNVEQTI
jgi:hypothetical protein